MSAPTRPTRASDSAASGQTDGDRADGTRRTPDSQPPRRAGDASSSSVDRPKRMAWSTPLTARPPRKSPAAQKAAMKTLRPVSAPICSHPSQVKSVIIPSQRPPKTPNTSAPVQGFAPFRTSAGFATARATGDLIAQARTAANAPATSVARKYYVSVTDAPERGC